MRWFRFLIHAIGAGGSLIGFWALLLSGHAVLVVRPSARRAWRRFIYTHWGRSTCRSLGVNLTVIGDPPSEASLVVCNHLGYLDIPVLAACMETTFVSKADVADWPLVGLITRTAGTIFVTRERKRGLPEVNRQIADALAAGDGLVVFPEGTSTSGATVAPFKASLLAPAAAGRLPVHYASLSYDVGATDPPASESVCWWGDMGFMPHLLGLMRLTRIEARVQFGAEAIVEADRKLLAEKLWQANHEIFIPVT